MPKPVQLLEDLRREIDEIDDMLHDLIMRRADVVERIRRLKGEGVRLRPAREAVILRRLLARHEGRFPRPVLVRIWREILGAAVRLQGPFSLAVYAGADGACHDYWTLARDEYGAFTPNTAYASQGQIVREVYNGVATLGVLPLPREDDAAPWWPMLAGSDPRTPRIVARLPFGGPESRQGETAEALAIARLEQMPSGEDRTYLMLESPEAMSRGGLKSALAAVGLEILFVTSWCNEEDRRVWLHLAEVGDFVAPDDVRLNVLRAAAGEGIRRVLVVGGYAVPIGAAALDEAAAAASDRALRPARAGSR